MRCIRRTYRASSMPSALGLQRMICRSFCRKIYQRMTVRRHTSVTAKMAEIFAGNCMWSHVIASKVAVKILDSAEYNEIFMCQRSALCDKSTAPCFHSLVVMSLLPSCVGMARRSDFGAGNSDPRVHPPEQHKQQLNTLHTKKTQPWHLQTILPNFRHRQRA